MFRRFKNLKNTLLTSTLVLTGSFTFWDVIKNSNSLLLFGEPEYPFED